MKRSLSALIILVSFILSVFFISCSHGSRNTGDTTVTFSMNRQSVNLILQNSKANLSAQKSYRAADDFDQETAEAGSSTESTNPTASSDSSDSSGLEDDADYEEEEEEPEDNFEVENAPYDSIFIDVSLLGDYEYQKTALVKEDQAIQLKFRAVPIGAVVYAQAQIYTYKDETKTTKIILYRGNSSSIIVRDRGNKLSIALDKATLTVTFDSNGGTAIESMKVLTGQIISKPENPTNYNSKSKTISAFMGWYVDPDFTKPYDFESPVTEDLTLYAKWLADYVLIPAGKVSGYLSGSRNPLDISELYVCQHEVTQKEYYEITGEKPSLRAIAGDNFPVENVSWYEAIVYCNLRSIKEGLSPCYKIYDSLDPKDWGPIPQTNNQDWNGVLVNLKANGYRLLTEAEWEYVARLGIDNTSKEYSKLVLDKQNSNGKTWEVNNRLADDIGICNILGNVSEWCYDWYSDVVSSTAPLDGPTSGTTRVYRGGDFTGGQTECSVDYRASNTPYYKSGSVGFRVARALTNADWSSISAVHTITYKIEECDEDKLVPVNFNYTDSVVLPTNLEREGYLFGGWYTTEDYADGSGITGWDPKQKSYDVTVYGKWIPITYTIKFNKGKSSSTVQMPAQTFTYDKLQELSECIFDAPAGLKFGGWTTLDTSDYDDDNLKRDYSDKQEILNITSENGAVITLYALWVNKARSNIIYMLDGLEVTGLTPASFLPSQSVTLPTATDSEKLKKEGYTFSGWYTSSDFNSENLITSWASGTLEGDVTVYGKFEAVSYTITYDSLATDWNWVSGFTEYPLSYTAAQSVTLPASGKLTKDYYNFEGWYFDSAFTQSASSGWSAGKTGNVTLYAKWIPVDYTIEYQLNGNDGEEIENPNTVTSYNVTTAGPITLASAVRQGYNFEGWYNESGEKITSITPGTGTNQAHVSMQLKASWIPISYTITYDGLGTDWNWASGYTAYPSSYTIEDAVSLPASGKVNKDYYHLYGWYFDSALTQSATGGWEEGKTGDVTLYGMWDLNEYVINYELNDQLYAGSKSASQANNDGNTTGNFTIESSPITFANPTRPGYTFKGWYSDSSFAAGTEITSITPGTGSTQAHADYTLYAKWAINTNHIYFKEKDGSLMTYPSEAQFTVEDDYMDLLDEPTKTGYDFGGWYLDSDYSGTAVIRIIPGTGSGQYYGDVDVYAKWNLIEYTINYVVNGGTAIEAGTCSVEESFPLPAASRAGYYFNGWCLDETLTDTPCQAGITMDTSRALSFDGSDGSYDRQITLYAKWSSAGVGVTVTDPDEKISLTRSAPDSSGVITFTATTDLSANFTWYVDGVEDTSVTGNTFTFNKNTHPKGLYTITVECGGYSVTQTVIAAIGTKLSPTDVLDIVFTDGSAVAYESGLTLTNDQKAAVAAIIFYKGTACSNDSRTRMLGLGIKNSGTTKYEWALQNKACYTQKLADILISKDESAPTAGTPYCEYTSTSGTTSYLSGDMDGSDNWQIIKNIATDEGETSSLAENYPIFNYANTYASTANLTGTDYSSGWYIPSLIELYQVHKKWSQLNSILSLVGGDDLGENRYYWSSSQYVNGNNAEYDYWSWSLVIKGGEIYGNNKDATRSALCIREF